MFSDFELTLMMLMIRYEYMLETFRVKCPGGCPARGTSE